VLEVVVVEIESAKIADTNTDNQISAEVTELEPADAEDASDSDNENVPPPLPRGDWKIVGMGEEIEVSFYLFLFLFNLIRLVLSCFLLLCCNVAVTRSVPPLQTAFQAVCTEETERGTRKRDLAT
jgi:hypothetical protein